ncbi:MAG: hydroxypyruvate isomerase family protein [Burkholderiales bacterium]|nr:hydroxypyruvate isomerase family protein [Burkholderiales bacterium]
MPRFAANLSFLYQELPLLERFEAAAADGFKAVEFMFPYELEARELAARLKAHGLQQVLFNAAPGEWAAGERGLACLPGREAPFREGIANALRYAQALECPRIHVMAGLVPQDMERDQVRPTYVANLRWAAQLAAKDGVDLAIEPINTRDIPRFFLNRQDHAHELIAEIGEPNVKVQMDLYHCQVVEGDVATKIRNYLPTGRVGHFQIAGAPARNEPDTGELDYGYLFGVIDEVSQSCGWQGWVGCEYRPADTRAGGTSAGLGWMRRLNQEKT